MSNLPPEVLLSSFKAIVDIFPAAMFIKDAKSRIVLMNNACEEQWGMNFAALEGTDGAQLFPAEQMEWFLAKDREVFAGGKPVEFVERFWNAKLKMNRTGQTLKRPIYGDNGLPLYLVCVVIDITESKAAQEKLRLSEEKLRNLFEFSPLGIAFTRLSLVSRR
jgi:PAS domain S-box-containing protein